jgi:hypothetical protein
MLGFHFQQLDILHSVHVPHFLHLFIGWWTLRLFLSLGYCNKCCNNDVSADISSTYWFYFSLQHTDFIFFFFSYMWPWTQGLTLTRKALQYVDHSPSSFLLYFSDWVLCFCPGFCLRPWPLCMLSGGLLIEMGSCHCVGHCVFHQFHFYG